MINSKKARLKRLIRFFIDVAKHYNKSSNHSDREVDPMEEPETEPKFEPFAAVIRTEYGFAIQPHDTLLPTQELYLTSEEREIYEHDYVMYLAELFDTLSPGRGFTEDDLRKWLCMHGRELTHSLVWVLLHKLDCQLEEQSFMKRIKILDDAKKLSFENLPNLSGGTN